MGCTSSARTRRSQRASFAAALRVSTSACGRAPPTAPYFPRSRSVSSAASRHHRRHRHPQGPHLRLPTTTSLSECYTPSVTVCRVCAGAGSLTHSHRVASLRFAMVIPVPNLVDCTVTQGGVSHTWSQYGFGDFSEWLTTFKAAPATLHISSGGALLLTQSVSLTTGPLVIALRPDNVPVGHQWPPTATSLELIAASYLPAPAGSSGVRLFNLSPVSSQTHPSQCTPYRHPSTSRVALRTRSPAALSAREGP